MGTILPASACYVIPLIATNEKEIVDGTLGRDVF